ncbi:MAG: tetratricopeptide repeat protein [Candidatus Krumholzibacteria bacterium]|nr:tetratricopeptide repeat protein [Candidatus Krumholzibacteria bacterium]
MDRTLARMAAALATAACVAALGGCWGRSFWRAQEASLDTAVKVDSLLRENAILQRRVYQVETALAGQQEHSRRAAASASMDLEEIKDQLNALLGIIDEQGRWPAARSVRPAAPPAEASGSRTPPPDSIAASGGGAASATDTILPAVIPPTAEEMYRQIYLDFSRMKYEIALEQSEEFLREYPDDGLVEEIRFLRGECYMELGRDFDALKEFSTVLQEFPRGRRTPAALLRMAISYERIGDTALAAGVVRRLVREYPDSEEAVEARERFGGMLDER